MKTKTLTTVFALIISGTIAFAQRETKAETEKPTVTKTEQQKDSVYYTCPMHPDVKLAGEGKRPTCEMNLEQKTLKVCDVKPEKKDTTKTCICPMHPDLQSDKPGKCPKCGMDLVDKKKQ